MTVNKCMLLSGFFAVLLLGCASKEPVVLTSFDEAPLNGMVYDYDNRPCVGTAVTLDEKWTVITDINGRFVFTSVTAGEHTLEFAREGFETLLLPFEFNSRTQVVYAKIVSLEQLVRRIEASITEGKWRAAEDNLARAKAIEELDPIVRYLEAVLLLENGKAAEAAAILIAIIEAGRADPVVYLSLADIYQLSLDDPSMAVRYLAGYLRLRSDSEVQQRYEDLKRQGH